MKTLILLTLLVATLLPTVSQAKNYYFCDCQEGAIELCDAGNDRLGGQTPDTAKQTFLASQKTFKNAQAGDTIHFCRGGSFTTAQALKWINSKSSAENPVTLKDYYPEGIPLDSPRPVITLTTNNKLFNLTGKRGHQEGYSFTNLDLRCTDCSKKGGSAGFFLYKDIDSVTIDNVKINGFRIGIQIADDEQSNCKVINSQITNNYVQGFLGGCKNALIENNKFSNNGRFSNKDHNLYYSRGDNAIIRGNTLTKSAMGNKGICSGSSIVVHSHVYPMKNLLIENNYIFEAKGLANAQCYGISVAPGYKSAELFKNFIIRGNKIVNVGNRSINLSSCHNCIVENNLIIHEQDTHRNTAISSATRPRSGDAINTGNVYRNNSIYNSSNKQNNGGIIVNHGKNNIITGNAIYYSGNSDTWSCFKFGQSVTDRSAYSEIDNNICAYPNAKGGVWANSYSTLTEWQQASAFDKNSKNVKPDFISPTSSNYIFKNSKTRR